MTQFTLNHAINCDVNTFWAGFFNSAFNDKLYRERLAYPIFNNLSQSETDTEIRRKIQAKPNWINKLPGPVIKMLGTDFNYVEEGIFNKSSNLWKWQQKTSSFADKFYIAGDMRVEQVADGQVNRIIKVTLEAKVFGIGGLLETSFETNIRAEADLTAQYFSDMRV